MDLVSVKREEGIVSELKILVDRCWVGVKLANNVPATGLLGVIY